MSTLSDEIARLWAEHDLDGLTSDAVKFLSAGTATDWGLSARVESPIPPISLGGGIPDPDTLPREELLEAMQRALAAPDDGPLRYGGSAGYEPLREKLAARYTRDRGFPVTADHFMLTNGSAGAIEGVCSAFLSPGDVVISEAPTFSGTLRTFKGHQAEVISVGVDEHGMRTDELAGVLARLEREGRRAKLVYTIANFQNPTGVCMTRERREELLFLTAKHGAFVLDDDAYGEIYYTDCPPPALSAMSGLSNVITAGTFSKMIATGLRVGWIHANTEVLERITRVRFEMGNSPLLHRMLDEFMAEGRLDAHVERMRAIYASKAERLERALMEYAEPYVAFQRPKGGFFLWVELLSGLNAIDVQRAAVEEGVVFPAGYAFFPERVDHTGEHVRMAYSWTSPADLEEGARRFARACERVANGG